MKFLEQDSEDKDADLVRTGPLQDANPQAHAFDSHMGPIIQMFEDTKDKFEQKAADVEKDEATDMKEYMMLKQDLTHQVYMGLMRPRALLRESQEFHL